MAEKWIHLKNLAHLLDFMLVPPLLLHRVDPGLLLVRLLSLKQPSAFHKNSWNGSTIADPDPALILVAAPGSPDPGGQKGPQKVKKFHLFKCWMFSFDGFSCILDILSGFQKQFAIFYQKFSKIFSCNFFKFLVIKTLYLKPDMYPQCPKMLDLDPHWKFDNTGWKPLHKTTIKN